MAGELLALFWALMATIGAVCGLAFLAGWGGRL